MGRRRGTAALVAVGSMLAVAVFAGCATAAPSPESASEPPVSTAPAPPADETLLCGSTPVSARALAEDKPATELPDEVIAALEHGNSPVTAPLSEWLIAEATPEHVVIMRKLDPPVDLGAGDVRDYELVSISASPGAMPLTPPWGVDTATSCTPRIDPGTRIEASVALDPDELPEPDDERIALLVTEHACNGGQPATGRVELVALVETETTVEVVIAVRPHFDDMARTCISNPPTPFTVDLEQALGDRVILDAAVVPPREVVAGHRP